MQLHFTNYQSINAEKFTLLSNIRKQQYYCKINNQISFGDESFKQDIEKKIIQYFLELNTFLEVVDLVDKENPDTVLYQWFVDGYGGMLFANDMADGLLKCSEYGLEICTTKNLLDALQNAHETCSLIKNKVSFYFDPEDAGNATVFCGETNRIIFRVPVDFNEMVDADRVLLSATDVTHDFQGNPVVLSEGKSIGVYMDDYDEHDNRNDLIADGIAMKNTSKDWSSHVTWVLKIDALGIRSIQQG